MWVIFTQEKIVRIKIANGRIIDPANKLDKKGDLYIADSEIIATGTKPGGFTADRVIKADKQIVMPGLVDLSARLREPGEEYKANIDSETTAAAASGITSLCCPPDTIPVIDSSSVVELILQRTLDANKSNVYPLGAMTSGLKGESLAEMWELKSAGCVGVSNGYVPIENTEVLRRGLEYASTCNLTVHLFCEDSFLQNNGVAHEGIMNIRLGLPAIPETAETVIISKVLLLLEQCDTRVHFCRISSRRGLALIAEAKRQGLQITADVAITHLHLTEIDLDNFNSLCHLRPPLRGQGDKEALINGVAEGIIDAICSDHQPHEMDAKAAPFSMTDPGASTIDCLLPLSLQLKNGIGIDRVIESLTVKPARILGIEAGTLTPGCKADICIYDPEKNWTVSDNTIYSAGKNTPFNGWEIAGRVTRTLLAGNEVFSVDNT